MGFLIDMTNVEYGDSLILTLASLPRDLTFLIDGGSPSDGKMVSDFINAYFGGFIDIILGTHLDSDHVGGLKEVVETCRVGACYLNVPVDLRKLLNTLQKQRVSGYQKHGAMWDALQKSLADANELCDALAKSGKLPQRLLAGMRWNLGDIVLNVLNPTQERLRFAWEEIEREESPLTSALRVLLMEKAAPETSAENNSSVVLELIYKNQPYALFASDAGADVLREVTTGKNYPVLKVPHHGSKTGLDEPLVKQFNASLTLISGGDDRYDHPDRDILALLRNAGAITLCSHHTASCLDGCPLNGFGNLCHWKDRLPPIRLGWSGIDPSKCSNNR